MDHKMRMAEVDTVARRYSREAAIIEGVSFMLLVAVFVYWWVALP